jgi:hypothetical protein
MFTSNTMPHAAAAARNGHDSGLLAAALDLAARGWQVLPLHNISDDGRCSCFQANCSAGKHPRTKRGLNDASTDVATIRAWWERWPAANLSVRAGPESAIFMIGPDGQAGIEALAALVQQYGALPRTPTARSGSGGRHLFFSWPADGNIVNRRNHRGLPIDVRGAGGYFVAPPSRNKNGQYEWENHPSTCPLAPAPPWLLAWCRDGGKKATGLAAPPPANGDIEARAVAYLAQMPPAISGQGGHGQTLEAARAVVYGFDLGAERGYQILAEYYNPRCGPPWSEAELRHKCEEASAVPFGKSRGWLLTDRRRPTATQPAKASPPVRIAAFRPFPLDALPPALGEYVDASAAAIGCDAAFVALPALAVVAGCIGTARAVRAKRGWTEPAIIWALTVGPSGAQKTPAFAAAVDPLMEIQLDAVDAHQAAKERYEVAWNEWKNAPQNNRGVEPQEPPLEPCYLTTEATIESVGQLLGQSPRGILMARDEADGWFQSMTRYRQAGGTDRPHWLELSRAGWLRIHRVSRPPLSVRRACCSVTGTIQPAVLRDALDPKALAAGLGARFLLAMPPKRKRRWTEARVADAVASRYAKLLNDLLALELQNELKRVPHVLQLAPEGKKAFVEWFDSWGEKQDAALDAEAAALAKLEGYALRLALLHGVVSHAAVDADGLTPIGEASMRAGIRLAEWFADEAQRVYAILRESEIERSRRELVELIERAGGTTTAKKLRDVCRARYATASDAQAALDELAVAGLGAWGEFFSGERGGRPTRLFRLASASAPERGPGREPGEEG